MKYFNWAFIAILSVLMISCNDTAKESNQENDKVADDFNYNVSRFADIGVLRYQIPGWTELTLEQQKLVYYLTQAGLSGRDIIWDQNYRHNLTIRKGLEQIYQKYTGDKTSAEWNQFVTYLNRVWFANGIHHHYSMDKMKPGFSKEYFKSLMEESDVSIPNEAWQVLFNDADSKKVVKSTEGAVDWITGFVEVYNDPIAYKGSYETIVQIKDFDMSRKMEVLSKNAQWFEDNSPLIEDHKKPEVTGVSYKTVNVAGEAGDASPATPIGVNLPNNVWIREVHGSKSVSLGNIIAAYGSAGSSGRLEEFAHDEQEIALEKEYGAIADKLHTALHEVVGHASGQINEGVGTPKETLKSYKSTIEEGRADLFGLYYLMDPKIEELGLVDDWKKAGTAAYDGYIRNGLVSQLVRLELGQDVEEAHMRNRQWVSAWVYEKGKEDKVIEKVVKDGKTYYDIKDYDKLRELFGELLRETQRITSEGDFKSGQELVETYGVKVDKELHSEVLDRNSKFKTPAYRGFVNPMIVPIMQSGEIKEFRIDQPKSFADQMLMYSEKYGYLD